MLRAPNHSGDTLEPVPATLGPDAAAARDWHSIVVGSGPAGTATAIRLARRGWRVLLVDRSPMPRPKVCGCCLSPLAVAELASLCPSDEFPAPLPLSTVCLSWAGRSARLSMPGGGVLSRESLDAALVRQAIAAGVDWLPDTIVEGVHDAAADRAREGVTVVARTGASEPRSPWRFHGRSAVIATGLADTVRVAAPDGPDPATTPSRHRLTASGRGRVVAAGSRIGVGTTLAASTAAAVGLPVGELVMVVHAHGYCGLVRLEDGRLDLAAAIDAHLLGGGTGPHAAVGGLLAASVDHRPGAEGLGRLLAALPHASFRATPALTHRSPPIADALGRVFRVGDAAAYVEPFTGEGIGWALAGGRMLADSLLDDITTAAVNYTSARRRFFRTPHARCRWVARGVRRPEIVSAAVELAKRMPWAATKAVPVIVGASTFSGIFARTADPAG